MGNIENISISEIIALLCGFFTVSYCITQAAQKFLENMGWFKKRVAEKKKKEREEHFNEWKEFYLTVKKETQSQEAKRIGEINNNINKLINSSNDMLRKELVDIYYKFLPYKKIPVYTKKTFMRLYEDYHLQGGNSFIEEVHKEVISWETVDDEEEIMREVKN